MLEFIKEVLLEGTEGQVYIGSLSNVKGDGAVQEKHLTTRDLTKITKFVTQHDAPGRGMFFCVGLLKKGKRRLKENVLEVTVVHFDIDFDKVSLPPDEIIKRIQDLPCPPTILVRSGHGLHGYYVLTVPIRDIPALEALTKAVGAVVGGDRMVMHAVALMRLPGSHNTKNGEWKEVQVIQNTHRRYTFEHLVEWVERQAPVILAGAEANPYLRIAAEQEFKPPLDPEERLREMTYKGDGDQSIHQTQLSVSASLMNRGMEVEEATKMILEATVEAAGRQGQRWDWAAEERAIRRMCQAWTKKHPVEKVERQANGEGAEIVSLSEAREAKEAKKEKPVKAKKDNAHVVLGSGILAALQERKEAVLYTGGFLWWYRGGVWKMQTKEQEKTFWEIEVEKACRGLKMTSTQKLVSETRAWLMRNPDLMRDEVDWDGHGKIACRSGMIDVQTLAIEPPSPDHYATMRIECDYDPDADCPWWKRTLEDCFPDQPQSIELLRDVLGAALLKTKPKSLMKALLLIGQSDSGKSNILNVLGGLFTEDANTTPFELLENSHGTMAFLKPVPWVLHEAFEQSRWEMSAKVKALLSGDGINVNIKNGGLVTLRWRQPAFWGSNAPPQFKEASRAMENRLLPIRCRRVFHPANPVGAAAAALRAGLNGPSDLVLRDEKPGLLNWALVGLQRVLVRGHFDLTTDVQDQLQEMRNESNILTEFMRDCVEYDKDQMVGTTEFYWAFANWWKEHRDARSQNVPSVTTVGMSLRTMGDLRIAQDKATLQWKGSRWYCGIKLNEFGLDRWNAEYDSRMTRGEAMGTNSPRSMAEVNQDIPPNFLLKDLVIRMQMAHEEHDGS